jgi:hypothetical protein
MGWAGHIARIGEGERRMQCFGGEPEGKRPLLRDGRRWVDNIKMDHLKWDLREWTRSAWLRIGTCGGHL